MGDLPGEIRDQAHLVMLESLECLLAVVSRHAEFGRAIRTVEISGVIVISHRGTEKTPADRDFIHGSGLADLYLTKAVKNAIRCQAVNAGSRDRIHWGKTALERETGNAFQLGIRLSGMAALSESGAPMTSLWMEITERGSCAALQSPRLYWGSHLAQSSHIG